MNFARNLTLDSSRLDPQFKHNIKQEPEPFLGGNIRPDLFTGGGGWAWGKAEKAKMAEGTVHAVAY